MRGIVSPLREDLLTLRADPLPPPNLPRRLKYLPHVLFAVAAVVVIITDTDQLGHRNGLGPAYGFLLALAQGVALFLALNRPGAAWWLSLAATVTATAASAPHLLWNTPWPFTVPGLCAHAAVLLLLALRVRARAAWGALALSVLLPGATALLTARSAAPHSNTVTALVLFSLIVLLGVTVRGRRRTQAELEAQSDLTAEERAQRVLLEERGRIARELHDVVAHHMSVISIQAQVAPHLIDDPAQLKQNLAGIRHNALDALTELRRVLGVLRSDDAHDPSAARSPQPTLADLPTLVGNVRGAGLSVTTQITGQPPRPLSPGAELSAYRIVQEALSNCLRHAPGSQVRLCLQFTPKGLEIDVTNTAPARPAAPSPGAGHGLLGMRERVAMLGGALTAGPVTDGGFQVKACLPAVNETSSIPASASALCTRFTASVSSRVSST
ncbi:sensor histidine kinase [Streptomyces sp. NPDC058701]|uniref:sensor histidine kinase n=1 Tax=Streptomyces sp. NPDC058701 TaxID=3346608 RepID=UPI0036601CDA